MGQRLPAAEEIVQTDSVSDLRKHPMSDSCSALGHVRLAIVGGTCGQQPFRSCDGRFIVEHNGEIYNYKKLRSKLESSHRFVSQTDSEVIAHIFEDNYAKTRDLQGAIKKTVSELDGVYAIVIRDEETGEIVLVRDVMGVRQLYYGQNSQLVAFASERKALWKIGLKEPTLRIHPGSALIIMPDGSFGEQLKVTRNPVSNQKIRYKTLNSAIKAYKRALVSSMRKRTQDFDRIGIIFSGGIDSVIIAWLAKKMVREVICYTGGVEGSSDIAFARKIAKKTEFEIKSQ